MKKKDILFILVSTVILAFAWIVFNIIHENITSTITDTLTTEIAPIQPTFDKKIIDILTKRQQVTPLFTLPQTSPSPTPIEAQPQAPLATASATQASSGGVPRL